VTIQYLGSIGELIATIAWCKEQAQDARDGLLDMLAGHAH
jgi:hypothetical protein